ncbi:MAG: alpha/beta hydrolase [Acidobacteriota bacterium]
MNRLGLFVLFLAAFPAQAARLELQPCRLPEIEGEALRCGTWEVFENRAAGKGRKIPLRVVVIPARETPVEPDPVVYFEGGPGVSIVQSGPDVVEELAAVLRHRDILLVDVRGTGGSHRLDCPPPDGGQAVEQTLDTFMDPAALRRCRETLAKENDLSQYTTDSIVDDVDEVRAALGYPKVNVMGASYGTRAALVYLRRHPESVRTVMLSSVLPVDARVPLSLAPQTQAGFDRMAADCAAEPACHAAFPDPKADLDAVLKRLEAGPAEVAVEGGEGDQGKPQKLRLSRNGAAQTVRYLLYRPSGVRVLPLFLRRAAAGDLGPLGQASWDIASAMRSASAQGLYLSVTCAEDVAFVDRAEAERLARGTFFGDFRLRQQLDACAGWPAAKVPASFLEPVRSSAPVLILAGENDPTTPVEWARRVSETLPGSRLLVVPGGNHVFHNLEGIGCIDRLTAELVERGSAAGLDLEGCRRSIRRPPFATSLE